MIDTAYIGRLNAAGDWSQSKRSQPIANRRFKLAILLLRDVRQRIECESRSLRVYLYFHTFGASFPSSVGMENRAVRKRPVRNCAMGGRNTRYGQMRLNASFVFVTFLLRRERVNM